MKKINLQTILLSIITIPVFTLVNIWLAYGYILLFFLVIGWEKKKPAERAD
ncbi:hypothetical protein ACWOCJ_08455 [Enterococcus pseudoavium]|uniref:hypothetical protein n=1 Tax=Enterococcus pseudoavium TaxID=44007 RepID=UPI000ABAEF1A|nr:hypothetical protein [Enterococcus pseudoavium]